MKLPYLALTGIAALLLTSAAFAIDQQTCNEQKGVYVETTNEGLFIINSYGTKYDGSLYHGYFLLNQRDKACLKPGSVYSLELSGVAMSDDMHPKFTITHNTHIACYGLALPGAGRCHVM